jgi:hypothetical protein
MVWLTWKLVTLPLRLLVIAVRTVRFLGVGRILAFGAGVVAGVTFAPRLDARWRDRLSVRRLAGPDVPAPDLADAVRHELAHSPRTWHLPQPGVSVQSGRVVLTGEVPHEEARADLGRTAGAVAGVTAVENRVEVVPAPAR